ncbi:MAG: CYTH domain-containing protein [Betaproteobacteria bacterium]|nr:CYTH domain-containing protein [Betaproteobacteria bacterium]
MALEIESKMALPVRSAPRLRQLMSALGVSSERQWVVNLYLDTPDMALRKEKAAIRQRQINTATGTMRLLTVKTEGVTINGASWRDEWEFPMQADRLDFSGVDDIALRERLSRLSPELRPVFSVDFVRQSWNLPGGEVALDGSNVELALDFGYIRAESRKRKSFCEIELELLQGDEAALALWGERLRLVLPELRPQAISKAKRGYVLLMN